MRRMAIRLAAAILATVTSIGVLTAVITLFDVKSNHEILVIALPAFAVSAVR